MDDSEVGISPGFMQQSLTGLRAGEEEVRLSGPGGSQLQTGGAPGQPGGSSQSRRDEQAPSMVYPNFLLCRSESAPCKTGSIVLTRAASSLGALWVARPHPSLQGIYWK